MASVARDEAPDEGEQGLIRQQASQAAAAAKGAIASFSIFPDFVQTRSNALGTVQFPVERVMGVVATWLFIVVMVILMAIALIQSELAAVHRETVVVTNPTLDEYESLLAENVDALSCPCRQISTPLRDISPLTVNLDPMCNPNLDRVADLCRKSLACGSVGVNSLLDAIQTMCDLAHTVAEGTADSSNQNDVITPQLVARPSLEILVQNQANLTTVAVLQALRVPLQTADSAFTLERVIGLSSIAGDHEPTTAFMQAEPGVAMPQQPFARTWFGVSLGTCVQAGAIKSACDRIPFCKWNPNISGLHPDLPGYCDSQVCPMSSNPSQCAASARCFPMNVTQATPRVFPGKVDNDGVLCFDIGCTERSRDASSCLMSVIGEDHGGVLGPSMNATFPACTIQSSVGGQRCRPAIGQCGNFVTEHDCINFAPPAFCAWDAARQRCGYLESWTCADGPDVSGCTVENATSVTTNDYAPSVLMTHWQPKREFATVQPDLLTIRPMLLGDDPVRAPLWRLATTPNCSCLTNWGCMQPYSNLLDPSDPEPMTLVWSCTKLRTTVSMNMMFLASNVWYNKFQFPVKPLEVGQSKFATVGEAAKAGFLSNVSYSLDYGRYFDACQASVCTYTAKRRTPFITNCITAAGLVAGLSVPIRAGIVAFVAYLLRPLIEWHVRRYPRRYGKAPPPLDVAKLIRGMKEDADGASGEQRPRSLEMRQAARRKSHPALQAATATDNPLAATGQM